MKIVTKRKALKFIGLQSALLLAALTTQIGMQFISSYRWVGFEKKQGSWYSVAMAAQGDKSSCQLELDQLKDQIHKQNLEGTEDIK